MDDYYQFDTEVNSGFSAIPTTLGRALNSIYGGIVATGADIASSFYNTLAPEEFETSTESILGRISQDALNVYNESPDAINALSLVGGALVPGIGSQKALDAWRNGSKAVNFLTKAGREVDVARATTLFNEAKGGTAAYRNLMWEMRAKAIANGAVDTIAAEAAILGTLGAHPLMEDYFEDPLKNAGISMLLGTTLGGAVNLIQGAGTLRRATAEIEEGVLGRLYEKIVPTSPGMTDNTVMQSNKLSIDNLDNIISMGRETGKTPINDLNIFYADKMKKQLELEQQQVFEKMASSDILALPKDEQEVIRRLLESDERMMHAQSVRIVEAKDILTSVNNPKIKPVEDTGSFIVKDKKGNDIAQDVVYFGNLGKFGSKADIQHHGNISALGLSADDLAKQTSIREAQNPRFDYTLEAGAKTTPAAEAEFAKWTIAFSRMKDDEFEKYLASALITSDDAPLLQAISAKLASNPSLQRRAKVKIADRAPYEADVIAGENAKRTLGGTPVKYQEAAERLLNNRTVETKYTVENLRQIRDWRGGSGVTALSKGAYAYFAKGFHKRGLSQADEALAEKFKEVYESPQSQKLRADLLKDLADKDGKIYLYRGLNAPKVFGQAPLESMAITPSKAGQFAQGAHAKTMLYKIDVEDVVGALVDIGPTGDNVELIVRASAREAQAVLDSSGRISFAKEMAKDLSPKKQAAMEARYGDLQEMLYQAKYQTVTDLLNKGFPADAIATRVNMPTDSVKQFLAGDMSYDSFERLADISAFKNEADVLEALSVKNKPLVVRTSLKKNLYTQGIANLNTRTLNAINDTWISTLLFNSSSKAVSGLGDIVYKRYKNALDIARSQLASINNANAGNRFITSTDHYVRNMGDIGTIASVIGKDITEHSNKVANEFLKPVSEFMEKVAVNEAALTEMNVAANLNSGLSGWRVYKDRQFWQKVTRMGEDGKPKEVLEPVTFYGKEFKVVSKETDDLLQHIQEKGQDLYQLSNAKQAILGERDMSNIGFWMPAVNPINKHIAYLHNRASNQTWTIYGKSKEALEESIKSFDNEMIVDPDLIVVRKGDQQWWSKLNGRLDPIHMQSADVLKRKSGSGQSAVLSVNRDILSEIAGGYEHYINANMRNLADLAMSDITDTLRSYSKIAKGDFEAQSLGVIEKLRSQPKDAAKVVHNTLLGHTDLGEYGSWKDISNSFESGISVASDAVGAVWQAATKPFIRWDKKKGMTPEQMTQFDYEEFDAKLFAAGVQNPFQVYEREAARKFGISRLEDRPDRSKRVISATNAMAATAALRFGELAHPIVNLMSMPILTALNIGKTLPEKFMGVRRGTANVGIMHVMSDGIRSMHDPRFANLQKKWEDLGYFKPLVSEATEVISKVRSFETGAIPGIEKAVDSSFVKMMSLPSDYSEALSRKIAMNTGYQLGKRLYPELDDDALTIFARDFMDKTQGNYSAAQRPVFFQGTAGMALGLFQTYMLTMAQSIYRNIEKGDWGALAKAAALQSGIFGTKSMPGFEYISEAIGNNFSDNNYDLTTGTYRAFGETASDLLLYGMPSALSGTSIYTRGAVDPRFPNVMAGVDQIVGVNMGVQTYDMVQEMASALGQGEDAGQAMLQALSVQTMSRPTARVSEVLAGLLGDGGSVNRAGNTVQTANEVWTLNGITARMLAMRPFEESKLREAQFKRSQYDQVDREARKDVTNALRTAMRSGTNTPEKVSALAEEYFRSGGSPTGWRSAYRNAVARTNTPGEQTFLEDLDPEDPFNHMINSLD